MQMQYLVTSAFGRQNIGACLKWTRSIAYGVMLIVFGAFLSGCTTNPATGGSNFTPFMEPEEEAEIGARAHPKILEAYGGV